MSASAFLQLADQQDWNGLIQQIPYAQYLGMNFSDSEELFVLPFQEKHIGNPFIRALHGGVIAGFLENAALLHCTVEQHQTTIPKPINVQIDYLRSAVAKDCYARCETTRLGRRVANIAVKCWQQHEHKPVAVARVHLLLE